MKKILKNQDYKTLESLGINTKIDNGIFKHRISCHDVKRACLKLMGRNDLKTSDLVSVDIIYNKVKKYC